MNAGPAALQVVRAWRSVRLPALASGCDGAAVSTDIAWRAGFTNPEVDALHAEAFATRAPADQRDRRALVEAHSLGWATARRDQVLVGFVNVVWDGALHAWLQDVIVAAEVRHQGVGSALVATARDQAAGAGCQWLHVDFTPGLRSFYVDACSFQPSQAGLLRLHGQGDHRPAGGAPTVG